MNIRWIGSPQHCRVCGVPITAETGHAFKAGPYAFVTCLTHRETVRSTTQTAKKVVGRGLRALLALKYPGALRFLDLVRDIHNEPEHNE